MLKYTTACIHRHISRLSQGQLFTTRELLSYGTRTAVDQSLYKMVRSGFIVRVARGVFVKDYFRRQNPTVMEVAAAKARAFGKQIALHGAQLAGKLGFASAESPGHAFCVTGSGSRFQFGGTTIYFKKTSARKMLLSDALPGQILKALWHVGKFGLTPALMRTAKQLCGRQERKQLREYSQFLPAWLNDQLLSIEPSLESHSFLLSPRLLEPGQA